MPSTTRNQRPLRCSFRLRRVTSSLTVTKRSYSFCSRVKSFTKSEPLTLSVSLTSWFISSLFSWLSLSSFHRVLPTVLVGRISSGMMTIPTMASCQLMENSATSVVTTVATLLTMLLRVPEITLLTPLMSVFMRVMMSPCFSAAKKAWGMCWRWSYIWFFMSKMIRWLIQALM